MNKKYKLAASVCIAGGAFASPLYAQFFDTSAQPQKTVPQQQQQYVPVEKQQAVQQSQQQAGQQEPQMYQPAANSRAATPFDYNSQQFSNTVAANAAAAVDSAPKITFSSNKKKQDEELIMMYMKDFKIYRSPSGQTRCSVQFAIVTTLPVKLSNISYRLQWPKMDTVLSFSNVEPQVENHFNYSLLGDGCYSMDRSPNIVINRCRAKGMSQRTCAGKVRWITRAS